MVSLQNGVRNTDVLRRQLPGHDVRAGMVFFNVVCLAPGHYHRAISGPVIIGDGPGDLASVLNVDGLALSQTAEIVDIQWGKLLFNLNNAIMALSGETIAAHFENRTWRLLMADQMAEALAALKAAGIHAKPSIPAPAWILPHILRLPTFLFRRVAASLLKVDPTARPSMWQDLQAGRLTEVDDLQGVILDLAEQHGLSAPLCGRISRLVHDAEAAGNGSPRLTVSELRT